MAADIGIDATTSLDDAFAQAMDRHGPDAKVIVLPFARYQLPRQRDPDAGRGDRAPRRGPALRSRHSFKTLRPRRATVEGTDQTEGADARRQTQQTVFPGLQYRDARAAIQWLEEAFGFERHAVHEGEDGAIVHAELLAGQSILMLGSGAPGRRPRPRAPRRPRVGLHGRGGSRCAVCPGDGRRRRRRHGAHGHVLRLAGLQRPRSGGKPVELRHVSAYPVRCAGA